MLLLTGTMLNALGILVGGLMGLTLSRQFTQATQIAVRGLMGMLAIVVGLRIAWFSLDRDNPAHAFKQLVIIVLGLMGGRVVGRLLRIQSTLNRMGHHAGDRIAHAKPTDPNRISDGFTICTLLFCAGPLGPLGAIEEGISGNMGPLVIKMVMDGLAAMGFVCILGSGVVLAALPVFVWQGTITLLAARIAPWLESHQLLDPINGAAGLLIFCVAMVVLELKRFDLADYLPSLAVAPLVAWVWR
jgi:uncharacterized membrane protein YqgA involved in biofilm formation